MTRDEAVAIIMQRLGNRTGTSLEARIISDMQLAQIELEQATERPWFLLSFRTALNNEVSATDEILLPDDFLSEYKDGRLEVDIDGEWKKLTKLDPKRFGNVTDLYYPEYSPQFYMTSADRLFIRPDPEDVLDFRWDYWAKALVLDSDIENAWLANVPEVLINSTGIKSAMFLEAEKKIAAFREGFTTALAAMKLHSRKFFEANESMEMEYS